MNRLTWRTHALRGALLLLASVLSACASTGAAARSDAMKVTPPRMIRSTPPARPFEPSPVDAKVEVMIDQQGYPDMPTLRISGRVSAANREVLRLWIQDSRYTPAQQGGQPVPGLFEMSIRNNAVTRIR